jgi:hypothetical protein
MASRRGRAWLDNLDPGVRPYVELLVDNGIHTYESCEGGDGHCHAEPTVRFFGKMDDGMKALGLVIERDLLVRALHRLWTVVDREPTGPDWELVFWKKAV